MAKNHTFFEEAAGLGAWQVLESLGEAMAVVDRKFRIVWYRETMLGCDLSQVKKVGNHCYNAFFGKEKPCEAGCPVLPVFGDGRPHLAERRFYTPEGKVLWREARAYPILDKQGQIAFVARISFDITHRKRDADRPERPVRGTETALDGMQHLPLEQMPFQPGEANALTGREIEVLRLVAHGCSNPLIGEVLSISVNTVKRHVSNIFDKLAVNDRAQAAVWAVRQGLA